MTDETTTVFEIVGGQGFFDALVERFYGRVEADRVLRPLYPANLEPGKRALALFLGQYWGGPAIYSAEKGHPRLRMRHAPFAIDARARDAWLAAMLASVDEADAPQVAREGLSEYFTMASTAMINRAEETPPAERGGPTGGPEEPTSTGGSARMDG
jgi:hemoglobin